jgi:muconate cycloisomerase
VKITGVMTTPINVPIHKDRATLGAKGYHATSPFLVVEVQTDEGLVGLGEVSCTPLWSGEDQVTAAHFIATIIRPALVGQDPREITAQIATMHRLLANNPFTKAGIEMALWDLAGKAARVPVYRLLGGAARDRVRTKYSVSGLAPERAAEIAVWAVEQGFTAMKVKVGMEPGSDLARVRAVREAIGPDVLLGVDANGGWEMGTALAMLPHLDELGVAFVEQPVAPGDPRRMARVRNESRLPVLADESLSTTTDALTLIDAGAADGFSIYVGMGGGIREATAVAAIAQAAGVHCTIGSNLELGIAQAAMIHLAISQVGVRPEIVPCDIISRFFYVQDIVAEPLPVEAGMAWPIEKPGLGVDLDPEAIARYRVT